MLYPARTEVLPSPGTPSAMAGPQSAQGIASTTSTTSLSVPPILLLWIIRVLTPWPEIIILIRPSVLHHAPPSALPRFPYPVHFPGIWQTWVVFPEAILVRPLIQTSARHMCS